MLFSKKALLLSRRSDFSQMSNNAYYLEILFENTKYVTNFEKFVRPVIKLVTNDVPLM